MKHLVFVFFCVAGVAYNAHSQNFDTITDARDGNSYKVLTIGNQTWFAQNLAYLPAVCPENGICDYKIYDYDGNSVDEAKQTENYRNYGVLYKYKAALDACPQGWHLPTDKEWMVLEMQLGMLKEEAIKRRTRSKNVGKLLKSTNGWIQNGNGTNASGLNMQPAGYHGGDGSEFGSINVYASFWTATATDDQKAYGRFLYYAKHGVFRHVWAQSYGFSVRCVKD